MMEGFLGERHLVSLGIYLAFAFLLYLFLRKRSVRVRRTVLGILSFAGLPALVWYPLACGDLLRFLPLELCSFTALLLPAAVLTGDRKLNNVLLLWSFGSFCAILLNPLETAWSPGDTEFWMFYAPHAAEAAVPPLMFALGLAERIRGASPSPSEAPSRRTPFPTRATGSSTPFTPALAPRTA